MDDEEHGPAQVAEQSKKWAVLQCVLLCYVYLWLLNLHSEQSVGTLTISHFRTMILSRPMRLTKMRMRRTIRCYLPKTCVNTKYYYYYYMNHSLTTRAFHSHYYYYYLSWNVIVDNKDCLLNCLLFLPKPHHHWCAEGEQVFKHRS